MDSAVGLVPRVAKARPIAMLALVLAACGAKKQPATNTVTEAEVAAQEAACAYKPGTLASATLPTGYPTGADIPIEHIVLIMQENRSFDHYYSELSIPGLNVASPTATNPQADGGLVQRFHFTTKCMGGGDHSWHAEHANLDDGKLDGFVTTNDSTTPMGYYDGTDLPYYYALATTFAISDMHFCSVLGPTWPNRMFYMAGTSWGRTDNETPPAYDSKEDPYPTMFSELDTAHVSWAVYSQDYPTPLILPNAWGNDPQNFFSEANFASDVAAGKLASVTMVEASDIEGAASPDEGPPGDVDVGQAFTSGVIGAVMNSQFWDSTVIFLTYDENGGMYDHVVPPAACAPDDIPNNIGVDGGNYFPDGGIAYNAPFNQYGFRVPFFVISPYAKRGYLSHQVTDHTSILRFVEAKFGLPAMTIRDANAMPPYDMFDFQHPDFSVPDLPTVTIDQAALTACCGSGCPGP